jgi:GGDEF domain-containing protein
MSGASSKNIDRLKKIKGQLLSSVTDNGVRSLRALLSECLDGVLAEVERLRAEADSASEKLKRLNRHSDPSGSNDEGLAIDPATGLPPREQAELAIALACQNEAPAFVVVMVVNQLRSLNQNFGYAFGDVVLRRFAEFVDMNLPASDRLFSWSASTIIALVSSTPDVRNVIASLLVRKLTVKGNGLEPELPVSCRWTLLPLMASPRLLFHKIDGFVDFA